MLQLGWNFKNTRSRLLYSTLDTRNELRLRCDAVSVTSPVICTLTSVYLFVRQNAAPGELVWNVKTLLSRNRREGNVIGFAVAASWSKSIASLSVIIKRPFAL